MFDNINYGGIISTLLEALDLVKTYLAQELRSLVDENVIEPIMEAKSKLFSSLMAAISLSFAAAFLSIAAFLVLVDLTGSYPVSYSIVGAVFLIMGIIFIKKAK
ncbi:MAG: hypothetical protein QMD53_04045 [Actinomycetota bacterium]|nr:hypothetical protein [Actinomycetota bacterium]